jgi:hypothetical protein
MVAHNATIPDLRLNVVKRPASSPETYQQSCHAVHGRRLEQRAGSFWPGTRALQAYLGRLREVESSDRHDEAVMPVTAKAKSPIVDRARRQIRLG